MVSPLMSAVMSRSYWTQKLFLPEPRHVVQLPSSDTFLPPAKRSISGSGLPPSATHCSLAGPSLAAEGEIHLFLISNFMDYSIKLGGL